MAKKSRKRPGPLGKDQSGCMRSLINIFDFRHSRSQKLLLDKKRGSRRIDGAEYDNIKLESLNDTCQISIENNGTVRSETPTTDNGKIRVKELMEEEMCGGKKNGSLSSRDGKQIDVEDEGPVQKNDRWTRSSFDLGADSLVLAEELVAERLKHQKRNSCSSLHLSKMVEELQSSILQQHASNLEHFEDGETANKPRGDPFVLEKQLAEATKVLVNHFTDEKRGPKDRKVQVSKELRDALQILNSSKEMFLKLLQDPNSQLVKYIHSLQDIQVEEGKFKVPTSSDLLERDIGNAKQPSYFWRRFKGQDRNSPKKSNSSEDLSRIVVLKPGPISFRNSNVGSSCSSLTENPQSTRDNGQFEKASFPFYFAEFKRKLKKSMKKDQSDLSRPSEEQPNITNQEKKVGGETGAMASPSRDHFFIERIPKSSSGIKKVDKSGKLKDSRIQLEHDSALTPEQRVSNIYTEAKKHLAEIVESNDVAVDTQGRKVLKPLGRIISYSGYSSPTICSPRTNGDTKLCSDTECQSADNRTSKNFQEIGVNYTDQEIVSDETIHKDEFCAVEPHISDGSLHKIEFDKPIDGAEVPSSEDIMKPADVELGEEDILFEISAEPCYQDITVTEKIDFSMSIEESLHSTILGQSLSKKSEHSSCPDSLTLNCSVTEKSEDLDAVSDATSRPSPISVLEPIFKDHDICPSGVKCFSADEPVWPRQIKFEDEISAPMGQVPSKRTIVDDDMYTIGFVKAVVEMSGLTWDELIRRSLFSDDIIDPSLIDEVDFLPDLLPWDFNLLFDIINEVVIDICWLNFGCLLSLATTFSQPELKGKDLFTDVWKGVDRYLKLEGVPPTLDQIIAEEFAKPGMWAGLNLDCECIGIHMQEVILNELVEDMILSCVNGNPESVNLELLPSEEASEIMELQTYSN